MKSDLPQHLHSTLDLLTGSLLMHATEKAPSIPSDLFSDMARRFNSAPAVAAKAKPQTFFAAVQAFISRPSFGVAAFAMVVISMALPTMMNSTQTGSGFRGASSVAPATQNISVVLVNAPSGISEFLEQSGDFEKGVIISAESSETKGAKVLVDFKTATIKTINTSGEEIFSTPLPEDKSAITAAIATAVSRL